MEVIKPYFASEFDKNPEDNSCVNWEYEEIRTEATSYTSSTTTFEMNTRNLDAYYLPNQSFIQVQGYLATAADEGVYEAYLTDDIALVTGGNFVDRGFYKVDGQIVEELRSGTGLVSLAKSLLTWDNNYCNTVGAGMMMIPDKDGISAANATVQTTITQDGSTPFAVSAVIAKTDYNIPFRRRSQLTLGATAVKKLINMNIPLPHLFEFASVNKVLRGVKQSLVLHRPSSVNDMIFKDGAAAAATFVPTRVSWWLPRVKPSLSLALRLETELAAGASIPWWFNEWAMYQDSSSTAATHNFRLAPIAEKPLYVIAFHTLVANDASQTANNMVMYNPSVTRAHCRFNNRQFPEEEYQMSFAAGTEDWLRPYVDFLRFSGKNIASSDGSLVSYTDYNALYPILVFDVSNVEENVFSAPNAANLEVRLTYASTTSACYLNVIVIHEREVRFKGVGGSKVIIEKL